jgi:hypothetical protein
MAVFFHRSLAHHSTLDEELGSFLNLKYFDEIAVEITKEMGPEYETFINSLYNRSEEEDEDAAFKTNDRKRYYRRMFFKF